MTLINFLSFLTMFLGMLGFSLITYGLIFNIYITNTCFESIHNKLSNKPLQAHDIVYKTWFLIDYGWDANFSRQQKLNDSTSGYDKLTECEIKLLRRCDFATIIGGILFFSGAFLIPQ